MGIKFLKQITGKFRSVVNFGVKERGEGWAGSLPESRVLASSIS